MRALPPATDPGPCHPVVRYPCRRRRESDTRRHYPHFRHICYENLTAHSSFEVIRGFQNRQLPAFIHHSGSPAQLGVSRSKSLQSHHWSCRHSH
ncbi:hypothetical protein CDAR_456391 [Caerostris darwini]|uniref:Uncharacterized protein n=1 Tax=Caerostris darwini TaxID=1538125 RepID=A0AAV4UMR4_9ARAC|nr:hypothetical protein CDAR_456391 [Caerostris darwini]